MAPLFLKLSSLNLLGAGLRVIRNTLTPSGGSSLHTELLRDERLLPSQVRLAQRGAQGELKRLLLRLTTFADIGLVGAPNAGKSTLLRSLTRARPKVAPYPFTTLKPHVGVMPESRIAVADLPGLIAGAATHNRGLGAEFLSLIEGCRFLAICVDIGAAFVAHPGVEEESSAWELITGQLAMLHHEITSYDKDFLTSRPRSLFIIGTKIDLIPPGNSRCLDKLRKQLASVARLAGFRQQPRHLSVHLVSATHGQFVDELAHKMQMEFATHHNKSVSSML